MNTNWVTVGFPISKPMDTHIYIENDGEIVQRCNNGISVTQDDVCNLSEEELENMLRENGSDEFCPMCLRYMSQIAP